MRIEDIMTSELITATMDDDVEHVRGLFTRFRFRHIPIIGDEGELVGIISDRDVLANVSPFAGTINERTADANSLKRRVHQIMTRDPHTAAPADPADVTRRGAVLRLEPAAELGPADCGAVWPTCRQRHDARRPAVAAQPSRPGVDPRRGLIRIRAS